LSACENHHASSPVDKRLYLTSGCYCAATHRTTAVLLALLPCLLVHPGPPMAPLEGQVWGLAAPSSRAPGWGSRAVVAGPVLAGHGRLGASCGAGALPAVAVVVAARGPSSNWGAGSPSVAPGVCAAAFTLHESVMLHCVMPGAVWGGRTATAVAPGWGCWAVAAPPVLAGSVRRGAPCRAGALPLLAAAAAACDALSGSGAGSAPVALDSGALPGPMATAFARSLTPWALCFRECWPSAGPAFSRRRFAAPPGRGGGGGHCCRRPRALLLRWAQDLWRPLRRRVCECRGLPRCGAAQLGRTSRGCDRHKVVH
jgi:hypothetical protein